MNTGQRTHWQGRIRLGQIVALAAIGILLILTATLVFLPALSPTAGAVGADFMRAIVGPEPVARLESLSYWMRDTVYCLAPASNPEGPSVTWSGDKEPVRRMPVDTPASTRPATEQLAEEPSSAPGGSDLSPTAIAEQGQLPDIDVVTASPEIGWQPYGPMPTDTPLMARAMLMVDPDRSYAGVALVRMDLSQLWLHVNAGSIEPAHPTGIGKLIPDLGVISPDDQSLVIAAFNGGFKAIHGHYGMMVEGVTLLQPIDDMATIAVFQNGDVRLGAWGRSVVPSPDMVAFRQNCPPLIEDGQISPALSTNARKAWGITNNADVTWRTGLGLTQDGRFLIYAVGNGTTVQFLAEALRKAGAYNAMQLDINQYYAHFVTYSEAQGAPNPEGSQLKAQRLLEQMIDTKNLYLIPYARDFFYVTLRPR